MFDWLKELVQLLWKHLVPFFVLDQYEGGVRLRLGKHIRPGVRVWRWHLFKLAGKPLGPGLYLKWPIIDEAVYTQVVPSTIDLSEQTVTTANGVQIVIESSLKFEVKDVVKLLLEVSNATEAVADMAKGIIRRCATQSNWPDMNGEDFDKLVNRKVKAEAKRWGLEVHEVVISTMAPMRSIRLLQTTSNKLTELKET